MKDKDRGKRKKRKAIIAYINPCWGGKWDERDVLSIPYVAYKKRTHKGDVRVRIIIEEL